MRRILALVLSVAMVLMLPVFAFAEGFYQGSQWVETGNTESSSEVTDSNGTTTKTTTLTDGTKETVVTTADGEQTVDVELSETAAAADEAYLTPEVTATEDVATAPKVTVEVPEGKTAMVEVNVANNSTKVTVMKQNADGTWSVVKKAAATDQGVLIEASGEATYAVVENDIEFTDVTSAWEKEAADFVSSRELMLGTGADTFNPTKEVSADMMMTVLARLDDGVTTEQSVGANWAAAGESWAAAEGYAVSGTFTRTDMVKLLYKYAGQPEVKNADLSKFADAEGLDAEAATAFAWCVENGIIGGTAADKLSPNGTANRGQLAAVIMRYVNTIVQ